MRGQCCLLLFSNVIVVVTVCLQCCHYLLSLYVYSVVTGVFGYRLPHGSPGS